MKNKNLPLLLRHALWLVLAFLWGCGPARNESATITPQDRYSAERKRMVADQLTGPHRDITNARVLAVMEKIPRHELVPESLRSQAYEDRPLSIGYDQTISQPYIVAFMTQQLDPQPGERVLEIGTGSGYQAAVLAESV